MWSIHPLPIRLHGTVLNSLSTGTTLRYQITRRYDPEDRSVLIQLCLYRYSITQTIHEARSNFISSHKHCSKYKTLHKSNGLVKMHNLYENQ
jgi:hypothetical protein